MFEGVLTNRCCGDCTARPRPRILSVVGDGSVTLTTIAVVLIDLTLIVGQSIGSEVLISGLICTVGSVLNPAGLISIEKPLPVVSVNVSTNTRDPPRSTSPVRLNTRIGTCEFRLKANTLATSRQMIIITYLFLIVIILWQPPRAAVRNYC